MADGLRILGACPRCGGELAFHGEAGAVPDEPEVPDVAPHLVLGRPLRP
jgi:hypothetical protein